MDIMEIIFYICLIYSAFTLFRFGVRLINMFLIPETETEKKLKEEYFKKKREAERGGL